MAPPRVWIQQVEHVVEGSVVNGDSGAQKFSSHDSINFCGGAVCPLSDNAHTPSLPHIFSHQDNNLTQLISTAVPCAFSILDSTTSLQPTASGDPQRPSLPLFTAPDEARGVPAASFEQPANLALAR